MDLRIGVIDAMKLTLDAPFEDTAEGLRFGRVYSTGCWKFIAPVRLSPTSLECLKIGFCSREKRIIDDVVGCNTGAFTLCCPIGSLHILVGFCTNGRHAYGALKAKLSCAVHAGGSRQEQPRSSVVMLTNLDEHHHSSQYVSTLLVAHYTRSRLVLI